MILNIEYIKLRPCFSMFFFMNSEKPKIWVWHISMSSLGLQKEPKVSIGVLDESKILKNWSGMAGN